MFKKTLHLILATAFLAFFSPLFSKQIPIEAAEQLVSTVIKRNASSTYFNARNIRIVARFTKEENGLANFYIFNLAPTGFVIISADDRYNAVLAFSDESHIDLGGKEQYPGLWGTLSNHEQRIDYIREHQLPASLAIQKEWKTLRSGNTTTSREGGVVVAPLTTTRWNQGLYYNAECPANEETTETGPDGRTYCGCGPIAMAQLIKFHNSPVNGNGSNEYVDPIYGVQSADFCNTQYNWANMPDELFEANEDVSKLIYHMGVSTFTYYSTSYTETYLSYMRDAYVNNFGFDQSANWFYDAYGDFHWVAKNDLDRGRPLLLSGVSVNGGAHTWVADGYGYFNADGSEGTTEYFHFNWGWGGDNNGWFLDTDGYWFPRGDESNSDISYYFDRYVIQNLFPAQEACQAPEEIYTTGQENDNIYLNVYYPSGEQEISFRYRKLGAVDWTETTPTSNFYQLVSDLEKASEYEFQARRKCCPGSWSAYSDSEIFTSVGFVPCTPLAVSGITTSSISDHNAYIYTEQPSGAAINHFRYRPIDTEGWILTDNTTIYYRYLSDLLAGTEYEVQVSQECSIGGFTAFSGSFYFSTTGEKEEDSSEVPKEDLCASIEGESMTVSSTTDYNSYVYTPQPLGAIPNQFRYRPLNSSEWLESSISNNYYRYLSDLSSGTAYEFQVRQECEANTWSEYSTSGYFTTTGATADENEDNPKEEGTGDCSTIDVSGMFTSSVGNQNAYIYTPQPLGAVPNQFRYRPTGGAEWSLSDITTVYYRYLSDLIPATNYEFQVRQECTTDNWSGYSSSEYFTTTGGEINSKNSTDFTIQTPLTLEQLQKMKPILYDFAKSNFIKKPLFTAINVYPNPASSHLFLHNTIPFSENGEIRLMDKIGRILKKRNVAKGENLINIELGELPSGIYFIQLKMKKEFKVMKFVKD